MFVFWIIVMSVFGYLLGGVNGAIILSKTLFNQDIRKMGSGNPGFTNFKRVYGNNIVSWSVILIDVSKTVIPVLVSGLIFGYWGMFHFGAQLAGFACMVGHCFPVWYGFKGGKAFMTGFATIWFVDWHMALIAVIIFMTLLFTVKIMSISSCAASLSCPISLAILGAPDWATMVLCTLGAILIILRHYPNFIKLMNGTESKFSLFDKKK